jgi:type I restriction enzyme S subunit
MYAISPKESELLTPFLLQLLLSKAFTKFAVECSMRVAMPKINREALGNCLLWYPSLQEQQEIINHLHTIIAPLVLTRASRDGFISHRHWRDKSTDKTTQYCELNRQTAMSCEA